MSSIVTLGPDIVPGEETALCDKRKDSKENGRTWSYCCSEWDVSLRVGYLFAVQIAVLGVILTKVFKNQAVNLQDACWVLMIMSQAIWPVVSKALLLDSKLRDYKEKYGEVH